MPPRASLDDDMGPEDHDVQRTRGGSLTQTLNAAMRTC